MFCLRIVLRSCLRQISPNGHPIGHGHPEPIAEKEESKVLDHKSEAEHLASVVRDSADLKTSEEFKGLLVGIRFSPQVPFDSRTSFISVISLERFTQILMFSVYSMFFGGRDSPVAPTVGAIAHLVSCDNMTCNHP